MQTFSWSDADCTTSLSGCGTLTWEITADGTNPIDATIFTLNGNSIETQTDEIGKANTYSMKVKVSYTDYATVSSIEDFTIVVQDACNQDATISVSQTIPATT